MGVTVLPNVNSTNGISLASAFIFQIVPDLWKTSFISIFSEMEHFSKGLGVGIIVFTCNIEQSAQKAQRMKKVMEITEFTETRVCFIPS